MVILLALLELTGGRDEISHPVPTDRRQEYGLSYETWKRGADELVRQSLLTVKKLPQGEGFDWRRVRNSYQLHKEVLKTQAVALNPSSAGDE